MSAGACAIVLAAGEGRRMGQDKALLDLAGASAIERVVADAFAGGAASAVIVRAQGAAALPAGLDPRARVVTIPAGREMIESVRAGIAARPREADALLVFPVDHALAGASCVAAVLGGLARAPDRIVLPVYRDRPGHPIGMPLALVAEIAAAPSLRDVIRADRARVLAVPVENPWVVRDLDTPDDLSAARARLRERSSSPAETMRAHRSRRAYHPDPVPEEQLRWLVDTARHASTSSFIQAYSVVAVRDVARRHEIAQLCADQQHIREAPVFLAICADLHKIERACVRHGTHLHARGLEIFVQSTIDAALMAQNLQLAAEAEGLGACMIGAARNHPVELAKVLRLPAHVYVAFGMTLGRAKDDPVPRGRMPLSGVLHWEAYDETAVEAAIDGADEGMRAWAIRTNLERGGYGGRPVDEHKGWSDRMAQLWGSADGAKARQHLLVQLTELGFTF